MTMASSVEVTAPLKQKTPAPTGQDTLTVLNAVSNLTVQRTIVEAFVKLVVCRKVTVQRVEAASGHVLDSHTTQEEESPVILDVHRHEIGDVCSALGSSFQPPTPSQMHTRQTNSSSCTASPSHGPACAGAGSHGNSRCSSSAADSVQESRRSAGRVEGCSRPSSREGSFERHSWSGDVKKIFHGSDRSQKQVQSATNKNSQERVRETGEREHGGKGPQDQNRPSLKKRKMDDVGAFITQKMDKSEGADLGNKTLPAVIEIAESGGVSDGTQGERNSDKSLASDSPEAEPTADLHESSATWNATDLEDRNVEKVVKCTQNPQLLATDLKTAVEHESEEHHAFTEKTCGSTKEPAMGVQRAGRSNSQQSEMSEQAMDEDYGDSRPETCSEPVYYDHDSTDQQEAVEMMSPGNQAIDSEHEKGTVTVHGDGNLSSPDLSPTTSPRASNPASLHDSRSRDDEDCILDLEYDDDQPVRADQESSEHSEHASKTSTLSDSNADNDHRAEECSNVGPDPKGKTPKTTQPSGAEDEAELDMLVIDISSSVSEQTSQTAGCDSISSAPEHESPTTERLDPFAHLFETSFPPLDRTHDSMTRPASKDSKSQPEMSGTSSNIRKKSLAATVIKTERDDDCMITAAFISPKGPRRSGEGVRSASHTVTSQRGTVAGAPGSKARGSHFAGRAAQLRQSGGPGGWEKWDQSSAIQQFNLQTLGLQGGSSPTAVYQVPSSHTDSSVLPAGNQGSPGAYMPNFLAATPHSSEGAPAETLPSHPEEGPYAIDYSQRTYQCVLCSKIFLHKQKFDRHVMMCGGHRPFKCKVCSKGFNQQAHLDTHMKFHIGIKRHRCDLCRKAYVMKGDLIRHLKTRVHLLAVHNQGLQANVHKWESDSAPQHSST